MMYRKIKYLADSHELQEMISKYNLKLRIVDNQRIFIISKCFVIEIYGLVPEIIFYFDLYSLDLKLYSNIDRILSGLCSKKMQSTYQDELAKRKQVLIPQIEGNERNTLKAEQCFFIYLRLMDQFLSNLLFCEAKVDSLHFSKNTELKYNDLSSILKDLEEN